MNRKLILTLFCTAAGAVLGVLIAAGAWAMSGRFLWHSWAFGPLVLGLAGLGFTALATGSAWFERTPLYSFWTEVLGRFTGRVAVWVFLIVFAAAGVAVGALPALFGRPVGSWDIPFSGHPSEYEPVLRALQGADVEQRRKAIEDLEWHPLPKRDIGPIRDRIREQLFQLAGDAQVPLEDRKKALAALGRYGRPGDVAELQKQRDAYRAADPDNRDDLAYWCDRAIQEIQLSAAPGF